MPKIKKPLPEDYVVCYRENKKWGFVYRKNTESKVLKYSDVVFRTQKQAESEAFIGISCSVRHENTWQNGVVPLSFSNRSRQ